MCELTFNFLSSNWRHFGEDSHIKRTMCGVQFNMGTLLDWNLVPLFLKQLILMGISTVRYTKRSWVTWVEKPNNFPTLLSKVIWWRSTRPHENKAIHPSFHPCHEKVVFQARIMISHHNYNYNFMVDLAKKIGTLLLVHWFQNIPWSYRASTIHLYICESRLHRSPESLAAALGAGRAVVPTNHLTRRQTSTPWGVKRLHPNFSEELLFVFQTVLTQKKSFDSCPKESNHPSVIVFMLFVALTVCRRCASKWKCHISFSGSQIR